MRSVGGNCVRRSGDAPGTAKGLSGLAPPKYGAINPQAEAGVGGGSVPPSLELIQGESPSSKRPVDAQKMPIEPGLGSSCSRNQAMHWPVKMPPAEQP